MPHRSSAFLVATALLLSACATQTPPDTDNTAQMPVNSVDGSASGSIHNLPVPPGVEAARVALAGRLDVSPSEILILTAFEREWSDGCLGLGGPAESCLMAITPGYVVTMTHGGKEYVYRTNTEGTQVRAE